MLLEKGNPADCQSAIRQANSLRYWLSFGGALPGGAGSGVFALRMMLKLVRSDQSQEAPANKNPARK